MLAHKSLAEVVRQVDNQKDLHEYILSHEGNPGAVTAPEVQYQRHPVGCTDLLNARAVIDAMDRRSAEHPLHQSKQVPKLNTSLLFPNRSLRSIFPAPVKHNRAPINSGNLPTQRQRSLLQHPRLAGPHIQPLGRRLMDSHPWVTYQWLVLLQWRRVSSRIFLR